MLSFSPVDKKTLYLGTQYVMKTTDGGLHWQTISPDLTGATPPAAAVREPIKANEGPPTLRTRSSAAMASYSPSRPPARCAI